jgi:hypothetical protein
MLAPVVPAFTARESTRTPKVASGRLAPDLVVPQRLTAVPLRSMVRH